MVDFGACVTLILLAIVLILGFIYDLIVNIEDYKLFYYELIEHISSKRRK